MTDHLSNIVLNALVDGELSGDRLAGANQHLAECPACTSKALFQSLLKSATAKAGQRYTHSPQFEKRLATQVNSESEAPGLRAIELSRSRSIRRDGRRVGLLGWAVAATLLLASVGMIFVQRSTLRAERASAEDAALVAEVFDQHIATLADSQPLQVISSDRHTVKPWFQGKIPFSFNLPQGLPSDTTLDGANLTYLDNRPVAQLLFSIGKHRVSVFLRQGPGKLRANEWTAAHAGFHLIGFDANDLNAIAISDVDPQRLAELVNAIKNAQTADPMQIK